ncbi:transcription factor-like 5 protein isoform X2 [Ornithorhynchus anatinus]|uniref:transcription factor-like 5 protein isoform X2 n=1 Tax=Ornithorhynchus anatinus TaxID=9258 RepID=UPI0010A909BE|nr:transcription factor-like 5 protein isoform X2 [Ornithorhynchus anatinus]
MSGAMPREAQTSAAQAAAAATTATSAIGHSGLDAAEGPSGEAAFGEQGLSFTTTDLNLVEMTEIEYTQLQHILYSHMEAQANEGDFEARLNNAFSSNNGLGQTQYHSSANPSQPSFSASTGSQSVYPVICQSGLTSDSSFVGSNQCLGHIDFQELRMMLLSESNLPVTVANQVEKTPNSNSVEAIGHGVVRMKHGESVGGSNKENTAAENLAPVPETRSKSGVRVRLEDRFNSIQTEIPRCQESQESGVTLNNLVTLIRHPPELMNVPLHQQQNKCTTMVKNKTAAATTALQFTYPLFTTSASSTSGNSSISQTQSSSNSCSILETAKHQDVGLPRTFSFCYQQEIESTKQTLGSRNKTLPEQVWIKVGEALCKQAINKRNRNRIRQLDTSVERRALGEIQNVGENQSNTTPQAVWQSSEATQSSVEDQNQSGLLGGRSQRRERHNRMERDRRRRIRICCDELNLLVPFCNAETDKATTLQWTTAFLKYIQERHGDSLKKEFESVFCGKTGRRLKLTRPDSLTCAVQENLHNSPDMEIK